MRLQEIGNKSHKEWWFEAFPTDKAAISNSNITYLDAFRISLPGTHLDPFSQDLKLHHLTVSAASAATDH